MENGGGFLNTLGERRRRMVERRLIRLAGVQRNHAARCGALSREPRREVGSCCQRPLPITLPVGISLSVFQIHFLACGGRATHKPSRASGPGGSL